MIPGSKQLLDQEMEKEAQKSIENMFKPIGRHRL